MGAGLVAVPACQLFRPQCKAVCLQWFSQGGLMAPSLRFPQQHCPLFTEAWLPLISALRHDLDLCRYTCAQRPRGSV